VTGSAVTFAPTIVRCPHCSAETPYRRDNPYRPFCSERCKLMDLGAWANESYRVEVKNADQATENDAPPDL
jgi:endogenous inhibitor of DNA gyrase (YacG/DUF329 family)